VFSIAESVGPDIIQMKLKPNNDGVFILQFVFMIVMISQTISQVELVYILEAYSSFKMVPRGLWQFQVTFRGFWQV